MPWTPSTDQQAQWEQEGYFIVRQLIPPELALEIRGTVRNQALSLVEPHGHEHDPGGRIGDDIESRLSRVRKLGGYCLESPLIWLSVHAGAVAEIARHFLGDDVLMKFGACFLKPARSGRETPWHQDNGLWRDGETTPFNFWMAIDPATKANGCMRFIPGTHLGPIYEHIEYPDCVHAELPHEVVSAAKADQDPVAIELQPGDAVCWHSSLFHYSPPNTSDQSRIAVAGVYTSKEQADQARHWKKFPWVMRAGQRVQAWPQEWYEVGDGNMVPPTPFKTAEGRPGSEQTSTAY